MMIVGANNLQQQDFEFVNDVNTMQREHPNRFARLCYLIWERHGRPAGDPHFGENNLFYSLPILAQSIQTVAREKFEQDINTMRTAHPDRFARLCELTWERRGRPNGDPHFGENHLYDSFTMLAQNIQTVAKEKFEQEVNAIRKEHPNRFARLCYLTWERHGRPGGDSHFGENHLYDSFAMLAQNIQTVAREKFEQEVNTIRSTYPDQFERLCHLNCERQGRPVGDGENHLYDSLIVLAQSIQAVARETFEPMILTMRETDRYLLDFLHQLIWLIHVCQDSDPHFGEKNLYDSFSTLSQLMEVIRGTLSELMQFIKQISQKCLDLLKILIINPIANLGALKNLIVQFGKLKLILNFYEQSKKEKIIHVA